MMTVPSSVAGMTPLFKINPTPTTRADGFFNWNQNAIWFGWNVTGVLLEPTSLSVRAICDNGCTYPIGGPTPAPTSPGSGDLYTPTGSNGYDDSGLILSNQTLVIWDPVSQQARHPATPLPLGMCTLQIFDPGQSGGITAAPRPGYFSPDQAALSFSLYTGEVNIPLASDVRGVGSQCATCTANSIGPSYSEPHPATISILVTMLMCILSSASMLYRANSIWRSHRAWLKSLAKPAAVIVNVDVGMQSLAGVVHSLDMNRCPVIIHAGASLFGSHGEHEAGMNEWFI
ncbi:hypothetical protein EST38_g5086 [Candolleomyces aberdarensis]|uniref:DUF7137 domain-containing protein n=1 Tax=Candolleomyces aberdarensis TaxID=2316362 RepID=A0A4Q2DLE6_9AGAR|nr:hypothetical protein EST38_g5086 [Candolleomyces aberdarensis]